MVGNPGTIAFADFIVKGFNAGIPASDLIKAMVDTDERDFVENRADLGVIINNIDAEFNSLFGNDEPMEQ
jgi:hypothetical protein